MAFVIVVSIWAVLAVVISAQPPPSFNDIINADPDLTTLQAALMTANVNISHTDLGPVTLLAPINAGFAPYSDFLVSYTDEQYIAHLQNLLFLHIISGEVRSTDLINGQSITAINGETILVTITETAATLSTTATHDHTTTTTANIIQVDTLSSDGILHQIDGVLLPSFVGMDLNALFNITEGFSIVQELLVFTGLAALLGPESTATVFAPTDTAFAALPAGALEYYRSNQTVATQFLSGHIISPLIIPTQNMVHGDLPITTSAGTTLTIEIMEMDGQTFYRVNNVTITQENILARNGIVHGLDSVLEVPGTEYPLLTTAPVVVNTTGTSAPTSVPSSSPPSSMSVAPTMAPDPVTESDPVTAPTVVPVSTTSTPTNAPSSSSSSTSSMSIVPEMSPELTTAPTIIHTPTSLPTRAPSSVSMSVKPTMAPNPIRENDGMTSKRKMGKGKGCMMMGKNKGGNMMTPNHPPPANNDVTSKQQMAKEKSSMIRQIGGMTKIMRDTTGGLRDKEHKDNKKMKEHVHTGQT
jgi:transforming growth factor-beta-induced protein